MTGSTESEAKKPSREVLARWGFRALMVLLGVVIGGIVFGTGVAPPSDPHAGHDHAKGEALPEGTVWTCSMHPQIRRPEPGQCPICGMDLIPLSADSLEPEDRNQVVLSDRARALSGLRTTTVRRRSQSAAEIRLLGRVEENETTLKTVTAWTGGRIERLHVKVTGSRVHAGQVIATLYSPEVLTAHQDLLVAKRQVERFSGSVESARTAAGLALEAARERLRLVGVPDDELARMEGEERPTRSVAIRTPFGGTVMERMATEGAYVTTGAPLYRVANLSTLWIQLDAYESDLSRLLVNQVVRVEVEAFPGESFDGKITFIDPTLDPRRRTARVRVEVKNTDGRLRPGMFAQAVVEAPTKEGESAPLVIPATAPLFTGRRAIVYVEVESEGRVAYEPRTVRLGPRLQSFYPVVAGLSEGERIVSRGTFVLDADLQIRGGRSMMMSSDDTDEGPWDDAVRVPSSELSKLAPVVEGYLAVQQALAADDLTGAQNAAMELEARANKAQLEEPSEAAEAWSAISRPLKQHAGQIAKAGSIERARAGFEGLSESIRLLLRRLGNPLAKDLHLANCPMAFGSRGATWFQSGEAIDNAYFGDAMRTCGEIEARIRPGGHLATETGNSAAAAPAGSMRH